MSEHKVQKFPKTRIITNDVCEISQRKHHIAAMLEIDVSSSREKIKIYRKAINNISFTAWLIKAISLTIKEHESVASYLKGKSRIIIFDDINVSIIVEKEYMGQKIPIPLIIYKANERSIESITKQIDDAKNTILTDKDIVLQNKSSKTENLYFYLPGFVRRYFWKVLLKNPNLAYNKMGNVAFTSIGMMGNINGWFIPKSVHPICFGIGSVIRKPKVINNNIEIREILNMSILLDHDIIDGANMARFIRHLSKNIENGISL